MTLFSMSSQLRSGCAARLIRHLGISSGITENSATYWWLYQGDDGRAVIATRLWRSRGMCAITLTQVYPHEDSDGQTPDHLRQITDEELADLIATGKLIFIGRDTCSTGY